MSATRMKEAQSAEKNPKKAGKKQRLRRLYAKIKGWVSSTENVDDSEGATAEAQDSFGTSLLVFSGPERVKYLIQAHTWSPTTFIREDAGNFYCLDMEESVFEAVVEWVRAVHDVDPFNENRRIPVIYVIGPGRPLTRNEMRRVNDELVDSGAYFFKRPDYRASFSDVMMALRDELARRYGPPDQARAWRRRDNVEPLVPTT